MRGFEAITRSPSTVSRAFFFSAAEKRAALYLPSMPYTGMGVLTRAPLEVEVLNCLASTLRFLLAAILNSVYV